MALWGLGIVGVVALWAMRGVAMLTGGDLNSLFISIADILGLLATYFALIQFMLMGRIPWIERAFGMDRLASFHRVNGYAAIILILLHPIFMTFHHMVEDQTNYFNAYLTLFTEHSYTILALIAEILFVGVVLSSMYIARKHLKFETWYYVHLMVYLAIIIVPFHQFTNGTTFVGNPVARDFWLGLYAFVALNIVVLRFGRIVFDYLRYDFTVSRIVHETPTVTSVYIKAKNVERLKIKPGQFILVRVLNKKLWWQEHPFTVSWIPHDDELRISVRNVGDYTADIQELKPGAKVAVSGPFGRFTVDVAVTKKRLFIAGGIGITPLRSLAEQASENNDDAVLLYANKDSSDVPLKDEIDALHLKKIYVYSDERIKNAEFGRIDAELVKKLVSDYKHRDIYLCGPPPMIAGLVRDLTAFGVPVEQMHYEQFALHP